MCYPETPYNYVAIDGQVCFHKRLFVDAVKPHWCITGPVEPLGSTNKNWWDAKLVPVSISIYPVDCIQLRNLLKTQHNCLCLNSMENQSLTCPPTLILTTLHPSHSSTLLYMTPVILVRLKKISQKPAQ